MIKKNVIRRTFKSKKNPDAPLRQKAPKIQRLITDVRLRRKRINKETKIRRWKRTLEATEAYNKVYDKWINKKKAAAHQARVAARKASQAEKEEKAPTKPVQKKAEPKKVEAKKVTTDKKKKA